MRAVFTILGVLVLAVILAVIITFFSNIVDTSPTLDDKVRGGHDF